MIKRTKPCLNTREPFVATFMKSPLSTFQVYLGKNRRYKGTLG